MSSEDESRRTIWLIIREHVIEHVFFREKAEDMAKMANALREHCASMIDLSVISKEVAELITSIIEFINKIDEHHIMEEATFYRYLALKDHSGKVDMLLKQHKELNSIINRIRELVAKYQSNQISIRDLCSTLHSYVEHIKAVMEAHLRDEEELIFSMLRDEAATSST